MIQARILLTACVMGILAAHVPAQEAPATAPASAPATTGPAGADKANWSEAAIELSERERTALSAVRDGNTQLAETAFYMLLSRAANMKPLSAEDFQALEQPSFLNLLAHPVRYRAQPIRLTVNIFTVEKYMSSPTGRFPVTPLWPKDRPVWELTALNAPGKPDYEQPLIVWSVTDPMPLLGKPFEAKGDKATFEEPGRRVEVAGLFYKLKASNPERESKQRVYPVLLVWQVQAAPAVAGAKGGTPGGEGGSAALGIMGVMVALLAAMLLGFALLKKRVRQLKSGGSGGPKYTPLRDFETDQAKEQSSPEEMEVDPLLKQAAEQFKKEKEGHDKHGPS